MVKEWINMFENAHDLYKSKKSGKTYYKIWN